VSARAATSSVVLVAVTLTVVAAPSSGCLESESIPARAAKVERQTCAGAGSEEDAEETLRKTTVLRAESKCHVDYCNGVGQVFGVKLTVVPPEGVTADRLARTLQCHGARAILGRLDVSKIADDDPYWLPGSWVEIEVQREAGHLLVTLNGDHVSDNIRLLRRATAYAASHASGDR
jgi:hypothetical protein